MRKLLDLAFLAIVLAGGGYIAYTHQPQLHGIVHEVQTTVAPCSTPLTYSIGTIDSRFGITRDILKSDLVQAATIWNTTGSASSSALLSYMDKGGDVTVNLVYDNRQASTDTLSHVGIQVAQSKSSYDSLHAQYETLSTQVKAEQSQYDQTVTNYKTAETSYNASVAAANARGGARPQEYAALQSQKAALDQQFTLLKSQETKLNSDIETLNALATTINQLIVQLNLNVAQYNQTGAQAGEFEEGVYEFQSGVQTIDIYEYSNHTQLVRVLAHELGHALGLDHVSDPQAIMYKINNAQTFFATAADIAELKKACTPKLSL